MIFLPTLISAIGGGLGVLGQLGSARRHSQTAGINAGIDAANATQQRATTLNQLALNRVGIGIQRGANRANLRLALAENEAQKRNAERLRNFAEARTASSREAIRRKMRAFDEFEGRQQAATAASGVMMSGSPLEVMAESAAQFALEVQDAQDAANFERNDTLARAGMIEAGAVLGNARARADYDMGQRGAALSMAANKLGRLGAQTAYQMALQQAEMKRLAGMDAAQGATTSALGSALAGVGGLLQQNYTSNYLGMNLPGVTARPAGSSIWR